MSKAKRSRGWQRWLWAADTSRGQKWLIAALLLILLGTLPVYVVRSFVPHAAWQKQALYLTLGVLLAAGWWLRYLYRRGDWKPAGPWQDYGPLKRALMLPLCVAFFGCVVWMNLAISVPWAITAVVGQDALQSAVVETYQTSGRRSCRYQFKVQDIHFMFFEFCIDQDDYERLPRQPLPVLLELRESYFGKQIGGLRMAIPRSQPEQAP